MSNPAPTLARSGAGCAHGQGEPIENTAAVLEAGISGGGGSDDGGDGDGGGCLPCSSKSDPSPLEGLDIVHHAVENVRRASPAARAARKAALAGVQGLVLPLASPRSLALGAQHITVLVPARAAREALDCHGKHHWCPAAC
jgi:hypothetical protein